MKDTECWSGSAEEFALLLHYHGHCLPAAATDEVSTDRTDNVNIYVQLQHHLLAHPEEMLWRCISGTHLEIFFQRN
jgi:hypothetical protein